MPMHPERLTARAHLASAESVLRRRPADPALRRRVDELRAEYRAIALEDHIREVVDGTPPLSAAQRDKLAVILRSGGGDKAA